jgi:hypothetical protein
MILQPDGKRGAAAAPERKGARSPALTVWPRNLQQDPWKSGAAMAELAVQQDFMAGGCACGSTGLAYRW